jgi:hypothetical protein
VLFEIKFGCCWKNFDGLLEVRGMSAYELYRPRSGVALPGLCGIFDSSGSFGFRDKL